MNAVEETRQAIVDAHEATTRLTTLIGPVWFECVQPQRAVEKKAERTTDLVVRNLVRLAGHVRFHNSTDYDRGNLNLEWLAEQLTTNAERLEGSSGLCENGCDHPTAVKVQLPDSTKSVCEECAREGGDPELENATEMLEALDLSDDELRGFAV